MKTKSRSLFPFVSAAALLSATAIVSPEYAIATPYGGVDFPGGISSFADSVIRYDPLFSGGPAPTSSDSPALALGAPNCCSSTVNTQVSLGNGGLLEVAFDDNVLTTSGNSTLDLWIFEGGSAIEDTFVALWPADSSTLALILGAGASDSNTDGFFEVGHISGSTYGLDLDGIFTGFDVTPEIRTG